MSGEIYDFVVDWLVVGVKADYHIRDLGLWWNALLVVFLRDPSPYLLEFQRKPRKTPNGFVILKLLFFFLKNA